MSFAYSDIPEQTGRTAIVTGANTGIGLEIARGLARKGARVLLACRDADKANEAIEDIRSGPERADLAFLHLDLANIASVRQAAEEASHEERIDLLIAYGAEIIFSDADKGTNEAIIVAKQIAADNPDYYFPYQYGNEANPQAHFETTGPEIIRDLPEIDIFIGGLGTGGTLMGNGRALRLHNPNIKIVAVAPPPDDVIRSPP